MKWNDVVRIHRKQNAIFRENNELKSLLFSQDPRRRRVNELSQDKLFFYFPPSMYQADFDLLMRAKAEKTEFKVFRKHSVDNYEDIGPHIITGHKQENDKHGRESIIFIVEPVKK